MFSRHTLQRAAAISAIAAAAQLAPATPATAADTCTRYAARAGSDANPGTLAAPKLTVQGLLNSLQPGETGCLRAGTYAETSSGYVARITTPGTTLRSAPGERARVVGIVYIISSAAGTHLSDLDIEGTGAMNTVKIYAPDVVVERNNITNLHRGESCLMLGSNSGYGQATRVVVRRNVLTACGSPVNTNHDHGIYAANVDGGEIVDNVIVDPSAYAIQLYPNAQRTRFAHNVVDGGSSSIRGGVLFGGDLNFASTGNVVEANVLTYAATYALTSSWGGTVGSGNVARANCTFGAARGALGNTGGWVNVSLQVADPQFVDRASGDYRLAAGSACLEVVGYDTARLIAGEASAPTSEPTPEPTATATPEPTAPAPVNAPPMVTLTSPVADITALMPLVMVAHATDDHAVAKVEFAVDGKVIGTDSAAPFSLSARLPKRLRTGWHTASARAFDAAGLSTSSPGVRFRTG